MSKGSGSLEDAEIVGRILCTYFIHTCILYFSTAFSLLSLSVKSKLTDISFISAVPGQETKDKFW